MRPLGSPTRRGLTVAALTLTAAITVTACASPGALSGAGAGGDVPLVLYNAQHEDLTRAEVAAFTAQTGIKVSVRNGDDSELGNQLVAEGDASPADVFVTENSPAMTLLAGRGLLAPVDAATRAQVPAQYQATDGRWVGWAARATVLAFDTRALTEGALPGSILDLAGPAWAGKVGIAPGGADFQAIVSAVLALRGEQVTADWLAGLKRNARSYQGNNAVMKAVNVGEIQTGIIYHYYWYKDQAGGAPNTANVALKYVGNQDPGAFVSVSGAGVLASSRHQVQAQQLVAFLTSQRGQEVSAQSTNLEYTVASNVASNPALRPLAELKAPTVDVTALNGPRVVTMMQNAGLI